MTMADDERDRKAYEAIADAAESAAGQDAKAHGGEHCWAGRVATGIAAAARRRGGTSTGPAQVATPEYCNAWERTFGGKRATVGQA
jgi:hypothetical protein